MAPTKNSPSPPAPLLHPQKIKTQGSSSESDRLEIEEESPPQPRMREVTFSTIPSMADGFQRALGVSRGRLVESTRPIEEPGEFQIRVKVTAVALKKIDYKIRRAPKLYVSSHQTQTQELHTPGNDIAGIVDSYGEEVIHLPEGTRIFGHSNLERSSGGLQEYALLEADSVGIIPHFMSDNEAACLPSALAAAWTALFDLEHGLGIKPPFIYGRGREFGRETPEGLIVISDGSDVDRMIIQLAGCANVGNVIVVGPSEWERTFREYGADHFVHYHAPYPVTRKAIDTIVRQHRIPAPTKLFSCSRLHRNLALSLLPPMTPSTILEFRTGETYEMHPPDIRPHTLILAKFSDHFTDPAFNDHELWAKLPKYIWDHRLTKLDKSVKGKIRPLRYEVMRGGLDVEGVNGVLDCLEDEERAYPMGVVEWGKWLVNPCAVIVGVENMGGRGGEGDGHGEVLGGKRVEVIEDEIEDESKEAQMVDAEEAEQDIDMPDDPISDADHNTQNHTIKVGEEDALNGGGNESDVGDMIEVDVDMGDSSS